MNFLLVSQSLNISKFKSPNTSASDKAPPSFSSSPIDTLLVNSMLLERVASSGIRFLRSEDSKPLLPSKSKEAVQREKWEKISIFQNEGIIRGRIKGILKGGFLVDIGVPAFLPFSQINASLLK